MNPPDIHPEALLDRARSGSLGFEEQRLLDKHLSRCSVCRFELSLAPALYAHIPLSNDDDALVARVLDRATAPRGIRRIRFGRALTRRALLLVAALAIVSAASAAVYSRLPRAIAPPVPAPVVVDHVGTNVPPASGSEPPADSPVASVDRIDHVDQHETPRAAAPPSAAPSTEKSREPSAKSNLAPRAPEATCADLFRKANQVRRNGAAEEAITLYRDLESKCAGSTEEISSRVLVGRIYLDRLADSRRALAAFDSYLAAGTSGPLREDALIGRALALGKLGRRGEEESAWNTLLANYPDSIYAEKAKARLNEIR